MTTTRPKRATRNATPAPPIEDDATIVRTTLDRILYTVDVMERFKRTREDIVAVQRGESEKTMAQVMLESRWHEHATKARKDCPLGSTKKKPKYENDEDEDDDDGGQDQPGTSGTSRTPKPTPEKKSTPSKAKLAAMKKKADAARRKAQREAEKLAKLEERNVVEEEELDESYVGMPVLNLPPPLSPESDYVDMYGMEARSGPGPTPEQIAEKPWLVPNHTLYPLNLVQVEEDVPGRVWAPPRGFCRHTDGEVVEIGPLTELETLDLSICEESIGNLLPEKSELMVRRMTELTIPYLEMQMLNPLISQETRDALIVKLEEYEKRFDDQMDAAPLRRMKVLCLPEDPITKIPKLYESIQPYETFVTTWYSSSRTWKEKTARNYVTQQDFLDQFTETDDQVVLDFQREMLEKAKEVEEAVAADKIKNFKMPIVHDIQQYTPVIQERMVAFREKLARIFQYEDFEKSYMTDPACRTVWKQLSPMPYENGLTVDDAEEELYALISAYKVQFALENPIIPVPTPVDWKNETDLEVAEATQRFLADVVDTVVIRELADLPTFPHRIPAWKAPVPTPVPSPPPPPPEPRILSYDVRDWPGHYSAVPVTAIPPDHIWNIPNYVADSEF